jgi:hypothetical protein
LTATAAKSVHVAVAVQVNVNAYVVVNGRFQRRGMPPARGG